MTTQNLALDISSVKLQIASVTKLHPKASPAYPTVWGASKSQAEKQHCALSKVDSSWRVTAWNLYLIRAQRSLGFMPRDWRSLFQNKNYCFAVLALHGENHQHVISASSWKCVARVMCSSPGTQNWGQTSPGSIPAAAQLSMLGLLLPAPTAAAHRKLNSLCWVQIELFFPSPFIQRFSLAYTWNHTLFNMSLHFKKQRSNNSYQGNADHSALWKSLLYYTNIWVSYL